MTEADQRKARSQRQSIRNRLSVVACGPRRGQSSQLLPMRPCRTKNRCFAIYMKLSPEPQIDSASGKKHGCETFRLSCKDIKEYYTSILIPQCDTITNLQILASSNTSVPKLLRFLREYSSRIWSFQQVTTNHCHPKTEKHTQ